MKPDASPMVKVKWPGSLIKQYASFRIKVNGLSSLINDDDDDDDDKVAKVPFTDDEVWGSLGEWARSLCRDDMRKTAYFSNSTGSFLLVQAPPLLPMLSDPSCLALE